VGLADLYGAPSPVPAAPAQAQAPPPAAPGQAAGGLASLYAGYKPPPKRPHDPTLLGRAEAGLQWAAQSPVAHAMDAVLNAPQRLVGGTIAGGVGRGWNEMMHPQQATATTHDIERKLHLPVLSDQEAASAPWYRKLGQFGEDLGTETLTDPTMLVPGLDVVRGASKLAEGTGVAARIAEAAYGGDRANLGRRLLSGAWEPYDVQRSTLRPGTDVVKMHEAASHNRRAHKEAAYADLIERNRPAIDAIEQERAQINARLEDISPAAHVGSKTAQDEAERLNARLDELKTAMPPELRQALLQRAYREGTPAVRRRALAEGYRPSADDQARPPLNILHTFEDVYEPTQKVMDQDALARTAGPVRYIRQGNRRASFDIPKEGAKPTDPLADRLLDRLVRGARLEEYHRSRRDILHDLGLAPLPAAEPILKALQDAQAAGDAKRVARLTRVLQARDAAAKAAEARRTATLRPGAALAPSRAIEWTAPSTAQEQALRAVKRTGHPGAVGPGENTAGETTGFLRQLDAGKTPIEPLKARGLAQAGAVKDVRRLRTGAEAGAADTAAEAKALQERERAAAAAPRKLPYSLKRVVAPSTRTAKLAQAIQEKGGRAAGRTAASLKTALNRNDALAKAKESAQEALKAGNWTQLPETLDERLFGPKRAYNDTILRTISDLQRDALFVFPFAHMKNISILAALGPGGLRTVFKGNAYTRALRANRAALRPKIAKLEAIGGTRHYIHETEPAYAQLGRPGQALARVAEHMTRLLDDYDTGQRLALMDELERRGITGPAAGGQIRDVLGDYTNQAPIVEGLRAFMGANFPAWRLGIVPRAMTKALREQPRATHAYARAERLASDDANQGAPPNKPGPAFNVGGPPEDYAEMWAAPQKYFLSASTAGPIRNAFDLKEAMRTGRVLPTLGELGERFVPGAPEAEALTNSLLGFPYPADAPLGQSLPASLVGSYFEGRPTMKQRTEQLQALGLRGHEISTILRREGY
jgi:hypothetical protein